MRTTLDIRDDVYNVAREIARERGQSIGAVISSLAFSGLKGAHRVQRKRNGVPLLPKKAGVRVPVTSAIVRQLLDSE